MPKTIKKKIIILTNNNLRNDENQVDANKKRCVVKLSIPIVNFIMN